MWASAGAAVWAASGASVEADATLFRPGGRAAQIVERMRTLLVRSSGGQQAAVPGTLCVQGGVNIVVESETDARLSSLGQDDALSQHLSPSGGRSHARQVRRRSGTALPLNPWPFRPTGAGSLAVSICTTRTALIRLPRRPPRALCNRRQSARPSNAPRRRWLSRHGRALHGADGWAISHTVIPLTWDCQGAPWPRRPLRTLDSH